MRNLLFAVAAAAAGAGCSSSAAQSPPLQNSPDAQVNTPGVTDPSAERAGSRLQRRVYRGDDGAVLAAGWWDSVRGESCAPAPAADGTTRCLPVDYGGVLANAYADAACTVRLGFATCGARYAREFIVTTCPARLALYTVSAPHTGAQWQRAAGACAKAADTSPANYVRLGAEVPPGEFVRLAGPQ